MSKALKLMMGWGLVALFVIQPGCGDEDASDDGEAECLVGTVGCPCANDACNAGLICEDNVCVEETVDTDSGTEGEDDTGPGRDTNPQKSDIAAVNDGEGTICAEGVVVGPNDNDSWGSHWGAGMGINFCQSESNADKVTIGDCPADLTNLKGFRLTVTGELPPELRIQFEDDFEGDDEKVGDNGYIVAETLDEPVDYLFEDAAVFYLSEDNRPELDPMRFTSVQFQIASHLAMIEYFDFCITDIEVILGDGDEVMDAGVDDMDGGVDDMDAGEASPAPADPSTDPACADPTSLKIIPNTNGWVAGCSNAAGLQGDLYTYSDPG